MYQHSVKRTSANFVRPSASPAYAWLVFALTFALLLSDYMSRQVLNAVFPLLKAAWGLSDTKLGALSSAVALMVGTLTFPLSVLADRWGRVRSVILMAALWSLATLGCAISRNYGEMLIARALVGVGEAAYGSVGLAIVLSIFPPSLRATLTGAFMAGGAFGSVFGMSAGGMLAVRLGWQWSFGAMAAFGFMLVLAYGVSVTDARIDASRWSEQTAGPTARPRFSTLFKSLFSTVSVVCAYLGSALQLFIMGAVLAWMPSFLNRYYGLAPDKAGMAAAVFLMLGGAGMIVCGIVTDRVSRTVATRKWVSAIAYSLGSFVLLAIGFRLQAGPAQLAVLGAGIFLVAGTSGPAGAMVARLTPETIHASAFGTLTLANNLIGLAPGPLVTGIIADRIGLLGALQLIPFAALAGALLFAIGKQRYSSDLLSLATLEAAAQPR
ncbi:MFS transporter [Trinickia sp. NRRL B-1857]|uniref:MFS transporter n=1 Tax=Trinickia sp. NRRL B-1857 TaxID=3162879 RepID=UPI003D282D73